jgi:von Willebrand factor type A domain
MRLTFLSPSAAFIGLAVVLPILALALAQSRARLARAALHLPVPSARLWPIVTALAALAILLAFGAAQPVLERDRSHVVRPDAEAFFVFDTTRSMAAAGSPEGATRFERAVSLARRLRSAVPELRVGVATLTDRVLPHLFPSQRADSFHAVLDQTVGIERPGSVQRGNAVGTNLAALVAVPRTAFFTPETRRRVLVVFTDAETRPYDPTELRIEYRKRPISIALVRVGNDGDRVFGPGGAPDPNYRPQPGVAGELATFAAATGARTFEEDEFGRLRGFVRRSMGTGGPRLTAKEADPTPLAAWAFGAAFFPLAFLLWRRNVN